MTLIEERSREVWQWPTVESILADLRFALRQIRKAPGFTLTATLVLAVGIAASVSIFTFVNAALLKPLPYGAHQTGKSTIVQSQELDDANRQM